MYQRKQESGWLKKANFWLLDLLCLQVAFWTACTLRHGSFASCFSDLYLLKTVAVVLRKDGSM